METDDPNFFHRVFLWFALLICGLTTMTSCNKERVYIHWMQEERFVIKTVYGQEVNEMCDCHIKLNNVPSVRDSINCYTKPNEFGVRDTFNEYDLGYKPLPKQMVLNNE